MMTANDFDLEINAGKARVGAERRCGELLQEMKKATGGQPYQSDGTTSRESPTLADMGITKDQQLARVPAEEFEAAIYVHGYRSIPYRQPLQITAH